MSVWASSGLNEAVDKVLSTVGHLKVDTSRLLPQPGYDKMSGGFGTVGVFKLDDQLVAVKQLHVTGNNADRARFAMRFARELRVWARLDHPNLLRLHGFYLSPDIVTAQFISPFHPLGHIGDYLYQYNPKQDKRHELAKDTALGLQHLHELKIVHGDLKETNVLVNSELRGILCDYGLAKMIDDEDQPSGLTTTKFPMSTRFASPELIHGLPRRQPSDIWAWACLFLKTVANVTPYSAAPTDIACVLHIAKGDLPADISHLELHESLCNMLLMCWDQEPMARPSVTQCVAIIDSVRPYYNPAEIQHEQFQFWDLQSNIIVQTLGGHTDIVYAVKFSPDGSLLASASEDDTLRMWNVFSGANIATLESANTILDITFPPNDTRLAFGLFNGSILTWGPTPETSTTSTGTLIPWEVKTITDSAGGAVTCLAFLPDGLRLVVGLTDGQAQIWDVESGAKLFTWMSHKDGVYDIALSPDGKLVASSSMRARTVEVWNPISVTSRTASSNRNRTLVTTLQGHNSGIATLAFSPNGQWLASGSLDETIRVWDVSSWELTATLHSESDIRSLAFSPDSTRLVSGMYRDKSRDECNVQLWDTTSWTPLMALKGHRGQVRSVAFSPAGERIASGSKDGTVRIWNSKASFVSVGEQDIPSA